MTYQSAATRPVFNIGRVIGRGFNILTARFWPLMGVSLVAFVANLLLSLLRLVLVRSVTGASGAPLNIALTVLGLVLTVAQFAFIWGAVTWAAFTQTDGRPAGFGECLSHGLKTLLPISGLFAISTIALYFLYFLLIIPGVIVSLIWAVTAQAVAVEGVGVFEAFSRSAALTRNNRMPIFALNLLVGVLNLVVFGVVFMIFAGIMAAVGGQTGRGGEANMGVILTLAVVGLIAYLVGSTLVILANACVQASLYIELRQIKDGGSNTAEVFA